MNDFMWICIMVVCVLGICCGLRLLAEVVFGKRKGPVKLMFPTEKDCEDYMNSRIEPRLKDDRRIYESTFNQQGLNAVCRTPEEWVEEHIQKEIDKKYGIKRKKRSILVLGNPRKRMKMRKNERRYFNHDFSLGQCRQAYEYAFNRNMPEYLTYTKALKMAYVKIGKQKILNIIK